jgi:hypothetical protein
MNQDRLKVRIRVDEQVPGFFDAISDYFWQEHWSYEMSYLVDETGAGLKVTVEGASSEALSRRVHQDLANLYTSFQSMEKKAA